MAHSDQRTLILGYSSLGVLDREKGEVHSVVVGGKRRFPEDFIDELLV